jgi:F-type H+-transporting ATPase subunit delta
LSTTADNSSIASPVAGDSAVLARRYAGALYDLAGEEKALDAVAEDLRGLKTLLRESAEMRSLAAHPRYTRAQLVGAVQKISAAAKFQTLTANFLAIVAQNRRLPELGAICDAFLEELASRRGEFTATVRVAQKLAPAQEEQLAQQLRALAGGKVHMTIAEDKSLLGGLVVKLGSRLIDASLKNKLARLERRLKSQTGEAA